MMVLIVFVCGGLGAVIAAGKSMYRSFTDLFCHSAAVYAAILAAGWILEFIPAIPLPYGGLIRNVLALVLAYGFFLFFIIKLCSAVIPEKMVNSAAFLPPELLDRIFSRIFGFLAGCSVAYLVAVLVVWGAFTFQLPKLGERDFRDSAQAHVSFFVGTMNVFTWSSSCRQEQNKMIRKLFPQEKKEGPKDRVSQLDEADKKALGKQQNRKQKKKENKHYERKKLRNSFLRKENSRSSGKRDTYFQQKVSDCAELFLSDRGRRSLSVLSRTFGSPLFSREGVSS